MHKLANGRNNGHNQLSLPLSSTISGILHASIYLDSILLPYYTGFDALMSSTFSGECATCVCRKEELVVGGKLVKYKGPNNVGPKTLVLRPTKFDALDALPRESIV
ncbi:hypothetical protein P8452_01300 [Trifolium repens]|nr:hypothetical protein P8452_01300 [Trifolium repens]